MINPKEYIQRDAINSLTGIKSSLSNLRKVIALTYLLYLANNKKSSILYAESKGNGIVLKQEYKSFIQNFLNNKDIIEKIDENPLLTSQIESLYVGITLMFALGRIGFENSSLSMTKERTGGVRYPKRIDFASNMMTFDLILDSNSEESVKETLLAWLQNEQIGNNIEQRICLFLNICIEDKFIGKVLFYLWNDVFKDGDTSLFKVGEDTEEATFEAFYKDDNTVNIEAIRKFLVAVVGDNNIKSGNEEGPSLDGNPSNGIDYTKYSFNGETRLSKKDLGYKIVMKYINEHSDKTFEELQKDLAFDESVDNKYRYKGVLAKVEDINGSYQDCFGDEQTSSDSVNYKVLTWWNKYNIDFIINFAKKQGWSVEKETE